MAQVCEDRLSSLPPSEDGEGVKTHYLKTWPEPFAAILDGRKMFEVRVNDRGFIDCLTR